MSEAESLGENRNSFVFPLTKMRRKFIISAGTLLDILPFEIDPDTGEEKKKKIKKDEPKREVFGLRKSTFGILNGSSCAFQKKISSLGAQVPAWPRFRAKRNSRREPSGRSGRELSGWQRQPRRRRRRQQPPQQQQPPQDRPRQVDRAE